MGLLAVPHPVLAQVVPPRPPVAPSQVTPRSLMPPPSMTPPSVDLPLSLPSEAPSGAETAAVTVSAVVVTGGYPELGAQTRALFAPLEGKPTALGALYRAAAALESAYSKRGYFLVRVVVPQQRIATGETFRVAIVEGFIESLNADAVPKPIRCPVEAIMRGIVGQRQPTLDDMRRRLDLAGALPGARLRSTLAKGEQPGGALLILDGGFNPYDLPVRIMGEAVTSIDAMLALVTRLLDAHAAEHAPLGNRAAVDIREAIGEAARRMEPLAGSSDVRITLHLGEGPLIARLDSGAFGQILDNLMGNAIRYSPDGGEVTVTATHEPGLVTVTVRDQGPGIRGVEAEGLFKKFARGRAPDRGNKVGAGMGLFIVATLAARMGIDVRHVAEDREGASFLLSIPTTEWPN